MAQSLKGGGRGVGGWLWGGGWLVWECWRGVGRHVWWFCHPSHRTCRTRLKEKGANSNLMVMVMVNLMVMVMVTLMVFH